MATALPCQYQEEDFAHVSEQRPWPSNLLQRWETFGQRCHLHRLRIRSSGLESDDPEHTIQDLLSALATMTETVSTTLQYAAYVGLAGHEKADQTASPKLAASLSRLTFQQPTRRPKHCFTASSRHGGPTTKHTPRPPGETGADPPKSDAQL